jgi:hypothetical protein
VKRVALPIAALLLACAEAEPRPGIDRSGLLAEIDSSASAEELYFEVVRLDGMGLLPSGRMGALQRALDEVEARESDPRERARSTRDSIEATLRRTYAELERDPEAPRGWEGRRYAERLHRAGVREAEAYAEGTLVVAGMVGIPTSKGDLLLVVAAPVGGYVVARLAGVAFKRVPLLLRRFRTADALVIEAERAGVRVRYVGTADGLASEIGGRPIDPERFARMKAAFERQGGTIWQDAEAQRYLAQRGAEAVTLDEKFIAHRLQPTASAVFEEFIHTAQFRSGRFNKLSELHGPAKARDLLEIEAAEKLIANSRVWGIPEQETLETMRRLERLRAGR